MSTAIVVVTYNRTASLKRLLRSLGEAQYKGRKDIPLIISVDNSGSPETAEAAEAFDWKYGEKRVIRHGERLGLKRHILECGEYTREYGSIIMLEDDLYVSPCFYDYAVRALEFTKEDERIGGVSLYAHRFNVFARLPFEPINDGFSNWYFQFASSWGQAWTEGQWSGFYSWLKAHDGEAVGDSYLPSDIAGWGESSWLKYADRYLADSDKYFLYPRLSYTTNFADEGEHASNSVTDLQVPLAEGEEGLRFCGLDESRAVYDAYFEHRGLEHEADLYGLKGRDGRHRERYIYSTGAYGCRIVESYGLKLKPMEANILHGIEGQDIFLYDTQTPDRPPKLRAGRLEAYFYPGMNLGKMTGLIKRHLSGR